MFRLLYEYAARLLTRPCSNSGPAQDSWCLAQEPPRVPDPYVWRLPNPYDARWGRWAKRSRAAGRYLPFPPVEACWQRPPRAQPQRWRTDEDPVRPYVLRSAVEVPVYGGVAGAPVLDHDGTVAPDPPIR
ncbi:hypothetical protein [Streptomyces sp. NBC_00847]|uniref:hypothetical protein n=1 Tax=Streptomyces sp. NBC_00847 TaxID=2975850 RepID=UPI00225A9E5A|nr:hypothetical protein [Streptomyces sp. NBC_00847]MCX4881639.1 hypothetical protein [Streptomyces sp. NBC_00847]